MCRWLAYSGTPILLEELLYKPEYSLIDQSMHSRMGVETTNGDGFGVGWYGVADPAAPGPDSGAGVPVLFRGVGPAWGDVNLRELGRNISSGLFLAHIRASTGTPVQQTNCHPFRHGRWIMVHNGVINGYEQVRRDLMLEVAPEQFASIQGSTDSEVLFHLALTYGLESDPVSALERAIGFVEATAARHGIENAIQASVGISDGEKIWALRYSTERKSRTLFVSAEASAVKELHIDNPRLARLRDEDRLIVSEPLADLAGVWAEIPESTVMIIQPGPDESRPFEPRYEPAAGNGSPAMSKA